MRRNPDAIATELVGRPVSPFTDRISAVSAARELDGFHLDAAAADVRGWAVVARDGSSVGRVSRLIVDTRTRRVRYLGVTLDARYERRKCVSVAGTVLVPVGVVRRVDHNRTVVLERLTTEMLERAPRLHARPITRSDENATLTAYGMRALREASDREVYAGPLFDDSRLFTPAADVTPSE